MRTTGSGITGIVSRREDSPAKVALVYFERCSRGRPPQPRSGRTRFAAAMRDWEELRQSTRAVELTRDVERHAGELARARALRGVVDERLSAAPMSLPPAEFGPR
jgi:hypothetical protein